MRGPDRASDLDLAGIHVCVSIKTWCGNHLRVPMSQMEEGKEGKKMRFRSNDQKRSCDEERENEGKREREGGEGRHELPQRAKLKNGPGPG